MPLEGPDQFHLRPATGYIELGMFEEANAELEEIDPFSGIRRRRRWPVSPFAMALPG